MKRKTIILLTLLIVLFTVGCATGTSDERTTEETDTSATATEEIDVSDTAAEEIDINGTIADESDVPDTKEGFSLISGTEARLIMESDSTAILLDVRSQSEFAESHIEGAINIPVVELAGSLSELPDKNAVIIVYCRAGRRSREAVEILVANGYTNIHDMQRMSNWQE